MKYFNAEELKMVTRAIADMRAVSSSQIESGGGGIRRAVRHGANLSGTPERRGTAAGRVHAAGKSRRDHEHVLGAANHSIWDRISSVSESIIATYILKEHPQVAALVLTKVKRPAPPR